jgi:HD-GYP domain-containing protein (c-di-GMP phosphodiesterase class II)
VDVWDALLTDRPYRKAWPKEEALAHIKKQSGKHFDPLVVKAFLEIIEADLKLDQVQESKSASEDVLDGHIEADSV